MKSRSVLAYIENRGWTTPLNYPIVDGDFYFSTNGLVLTQGYMPPLFKHDQQKDFNPMAKVEFDEPCS